MYQPLTLKPVKSAKVGIGATVKQGVVQHNDTSGNKAYTEVPVRTQRLGTEKRHVVFVQVPNDAADAAPAWVVAGIVHINGVGRWGVKSFGADSKPSLWAETSTGVKYDPQPYGYEEGGTLADAVERVVHEFMGHVEDAAKEARKSPEQVAAEAKVIEDRKAAQQAAHDFIADDETSQRDRYYAHLVQTHGVGGVILPYDEPMVERLMETYDNVAAARARRVR